MLANDTWRTEAERLWGEEGTKWLAGSLSRVNEGARRLDGATLGAWTKYRNAGGDMSLADFGAAHAMSVAKDARDRAIAALESGGLMADSAEQADLDRQSAIAVARSRLIKEPNPEDDN